jgi:hypothetical membrane protein
VLGSGRDAAHHTQIAKLAHLPGEISKMRICGQKDESKNWGAASLLDLVVVAAVLLGSLHASDRPFLSRSAGVFFLFFLFLLLCKGRGPKVASNIGQVFVMLELQ